MASPPASTPIRSPPLLRSSSPNPKEQPALIGSPNQIEAVRAG
jgi:hypothetical protein